MEQPKFVKEITLTHAVYGKGEKVDVYLGQYMDNGAPALFATLAGTQEHYGTFTVNVPEFFPMEREILIKDYSENEGILQDLVDVGLITASHDTYNTGFVQLKRCYLSENLTD